MGKVKPKRKSTLIDMTAMSDVTVLDPVVSIGAKGSHGKPHHSAYIA